MDNTTQVALQTSLYVLLVPLITGVLAAVWATRKEASPPAAALRATFFIVGLGTLAARLGIEGQLTVFTNEATYWAWTASLGGIFTLALHAPGMRRGLFALVIAVGATVLCWPLWEGSAQTVAIAAVAGLIGAAVALPPDTAALGQFSTIGALALTIGGLAAVVAAFGSLRYGQHAGAIAAVGGAAAMLLLILGRRSERPASAPGVGVFLLGYLLLGLTMAHVYVELSLALIAPLLLAAIVIPRIAAPSLGGKRSMSVVLAALLALGVAGAIGYAQYEPDPYAYGSY